MSKLDRMQDTEITDMVRVEGVTIDEVQKRYLISFDDTRWLKEVLSSTRKSKQRAIKIYFGETTF